ncbi:N-acetylmuramoyl-L-alanine amidase [Pseudaestuariivita rosea]|uniref:N-acetylmuramoyl-L-alanine amidase n=1 Tax=Pseudaestuariivita rosea TaxID=2763263 RepID=UPI001F177234|nr:N-acetylmuramoyl-L-alanine amidase [Pseudaestuariivita rosea]
MIKQVFLAFVACLGVASAAWAQDVPQTARVDVARSSISDTRDGLNVALHLDRAVPYRAFTLDDPRRLVLDFRSLDWTGVRPAVVLNADNARNLRFGRIGDGWSRMILDLAQPMVVDHATLRGGLLDVDLKAVDQATFALASNVPEGLDWQIDAPLRTVVSDDNRLIVMLDPGHGGIDPGAMVGGLVEADLMLEFARELRAMLTQTGQVDVVLTRDADVFVPLGARISAAHRARADLFISLHADVLPEGQARGATVYTLAKTASDTASALLAQRHDRADLIAGVDLSAQDDQIAMVLMDIARLETDPRSVHLAQTLVKGLDKHAGPINSRPHRQAGFNVLKAADIPSVLIELGFMSDATDRKRLQSPEWRAKAARGITEAILLWQHGDQARARLVRN